MNICVRCKHYSHEVQNPAAPNVWYNHFCGHPSMAREPGVDPVTGEKCFFSRSDLGRVVPTDDQHPHCRDVNHDGNCELYEQGR